MPISADITVLNSKKSAAVSLAADTDLSTVFVSQGFARRLYVGTGGTVVAQKVGDAAAISYLNVANGQYLDGCWKIVKSTGNGTTASNIVAEE